MTAPPADWRRF